VFIPVIKNATPRSVDDIDTELLRLSRKSKKARALKEEDISGQHFNISSLGKTYGN